MTERNSNLKRSISLHQEDDEINVRYSAGTTQLSLYFWELWKGVDVAHRIQPLDEYKDNP